MICFKECLKNFVLLAVGVLEFIDENRPVFFLQVPDQLIPVASCKNSLMQQADHVIIGYKSSCLFDLPDFCNNPVYRHGGDVVNDV